MFELTNEIAVLVTAILALAVGSIWYSPLLFGISWMKSAGLDEMHLETQKSKMVHMLILGVAGHVLFFFLFSIVLRYAEVVSVSFLNVAWSILMLCGSLLISMTVWEGRPVRYFLIHIGYAAVVIFAGSAVLTYWPW